MNTKLNQINQKNQPKGGFTMFKRFGLSAALIGLGIVGFVGVLGQAQTANVTSTVAFFNQSVFISKVADFPVASAITKEDVEKGCKSLGKAKVNIDASSAYTITAQVTAAIVPAGAKISSGKNEDAFHLDTKEVCSNQGFDGSSGLLIGSGGSTAGTAGVDYEVNIGVFFKNLGAYFTDAPNGNYSATVTVTITD